MLGMLEVVNDSFNRYMVECESVYWSRVLVTITCFNRYMVECEFVGNPYLAVFLAVLIDTWWNVNTIAVTRKRSNGVVLIDTWWNVNFSLSCSFSLFLSF